MIAILVWLACDVVLLLLVVWIWRGRSRKEMRAARQRQEFTRALGRVRDIQRHQIQGFIDAVEKPPGENEGG